MASYYLAQSCARSQAQSQYPHRQSHHAHTAKGAPVHRALVTITPAGTVQSSCPRHQSHRTTPGGTVLPQSHRTTSTAGALMLAPPDDGPRHTPPNSNRRSRLHRRTGHQPTGHPRRLASRRNRGTFGHSRRYLLTHRLSLRHIEHIHHAEACQGGPFLPVLTLPRHRRQDR